jgi:hypothetical protein
MNCWLDSVYEGDYNIQDKKLAVGAMISEEMRAAVYEETGFRCSAGIAHISCYFLEQRNLVIIRVYVCITIGDLIIKRGGDSINQFNPTHHILVSVTSQDPNIISRGLIARN